MRKEIFRLTQSKIKSSIVREAYELQPERGAWASDSLPSGSGSARFGKNSRNDRASCSLSAFETG
ncbi:MAG: hypothetical protein FWJ85_03900 [Solitalea sp.]